MKSDIVVVQAPVSVDMECPHCEEDLCFDYSHFVGMIGEPCDWSGEKFECPECEKEIEIDDVDWS